MFKHRLARIMVEEGSKTVKAANVLFMLEISLFLSFMKEMYTVSSAGPPWRGLLMIN